MRGFLGGMVGARAVHPSLVGGCVPTGVELKGTSELVRGLHDALKPKLYYAYDRYVDEYLLIYT